MSEDAGSRCGAPCHYGGLSATRKHSRASLGHMGHCNRRVKGQRRCWQHAQARSAAVSQQDREQS